MKTIKNYNGNLDIINYDIDGEYIGSISYNYNDEIGIYDNRDDYIKHLSERFGEDVANEIADIAENSVNESFYSVTDDIVLINGLMWDNDNIADHMTFAEAKKAASAAGKRLPTQKEWDELLALPSEWDDKLDGLWIAESLRDLAEKDRSKCLFLPAFGKYGPRGYDQETSYCIYWSTTPCSESQVFNLYVGSDCKCTTDYNGKKNKLSVRCVNTH